MELQKAKEIAHTIQEQLAPFCDRIEISGSVRREQKQIENLGFVLTPKDLKGLDAILNGYSTIRGNLLKGGKYQQLYLPEHDLYLNLYTADDDNFGYTMMLRTGSKCFNQYCMFPTLKRKRYKLQNGKVFKKGVVIPLREEEDVFKILKMEYISPNLRYIEDVRFYKLDKYVSNP